MKIKINNKYYLTSDTKQYILHYIKGKNETLTFFKTIGSVVESLINEQIRMNKTIKTLNSLDKKILQYGKEIEKTFKKT